MQDKIIITKMCQSGNRLNKNNNDKSKVLFAKYLGAD
jgi:hypothetical protein